MTRPFTLTDAVWRLASIHCLGRHPVRSQTFSPPHTEKPGSLFHDWDKLSLGSFTYMIKTMNITFLEPQYATDVILVNTDMFMNSNYKHDQSETLYLAPCHQFAIRRGAKAKVCAVGLGVLNDLMMLSVIKATWLMIESRRRGCLPQRPVLEYLCDLRMLAHSMSNIFVPFLFITKHATRF